jgi:RimJ/RimL family protein N-acetyltransferase
MPDLATHIAFVRSQPYAAWYIIEQNHKPAGAIYLTHNDEIGIHITKAHQKQGLATEAIQLLMKEHPRPSYKANIAPMNNISAKLFMGLGFELIQNTFERRNG